MKESLSLPVWAKNGLELKRSVPLRVDWVNLQTIGHPASPAQGLRLRKSNYTQCIEGEAFNQSSIFYTSVDNGCLAQNAWR